MTSSIKFNIDDTVQTYQGWTGIVTRIEGEYTSIYRNKYTYMVFDITTRREYRFQEWQLNRCVTVADFVSPHYFQD